MSRLQTFQVLPDVPEPISFLETLSRNLWWSWQVDATGLFRRIDPNLWDKSRRNPIVFLTMVSQKRFDELTNDQGFLADMKSVERRFKDLVCSPAKYSQYPFGNQGAIAYFSMEFGIHESLPFFAGGLGILAGDHLKAASDMAVPLTGVGIFYRYGYFRQLLNQDGMQQEEYPEVNIYNIPVERARDASGKEFHISVFQSDQNIQAAVWKVKVGRVPLYLLDANIPENPPEIRNITSRLYPANSKLRIAQEILLGIGGIRALSAMKIYPSVCHMNEGHAAFATLERLAQTMKAFNVNIETSLEIVPRSTVFTTHTPVAAGYDEFPPDQVKPYLYPMEKKLGCNADEILSWGQSLSGGREGPLSMFVLGLRMAQFCNGVSKLHGEVARHMWSNVWPNLPEKEIPISHITNGVHIPTWASYEISMLFERYMGPEWNLHPWNPDVINRINDIFDEELWRAHEMCRSRLISTCRRMMSLQYGRRNASKKIMNEVESVLDQGILTIAFARRFTSYKRADLLLTEPERLEAIITSKTMPVQFIFAGKAHPRDNEGKELIKRIVDFAKTPGLRHRIIFLENYDINTAKHLVSGADVWLNTPRRPFEACGTSGMKAAVNGVLNVSILDGWWCEGYSEETGWKIGNGETYADYAEQDIVESQALYNVLENEVIPCFYERKRGGMPLRWIKMMKESIKMVILGFCSHKMVSDYEKRYYLPIAGSLPRLVENDGERAKKFTKQRKRLGGLWKNITIEPPERDHQDGPFRVGDSFFVKTLVNLGEIKSEEVEVQLFYGRIESGDALVSEETKIMNMEKEYGNGRYKYSCTMNCDDAGRYGFTARVVPAGDNWIKNTPGFITWPHEVKKER